MQPQLFIQYTKLQISEVHSMEVNIPTTWTNRQVSPVKTKVSVQNLSAGEYILDQPFSTF